MTKVMTITALIISFILYWATSSVCNFNKVLDKKANFENVLSKEVKPSLGYTKLYYFEEFWSSGILFLVLTYKVRLFVVLRDFYFWC